MERKDKIIAIGDESFTLGFELVGIETKPAKDFEEELNRDENGVIILSEKDHENLSNRLKKKIETTIKPIIITLSENETKGNSLRDKIVRVLGVDIMKK